MKKVLMLILGIAVVLIFGLISCAPPAPPPASPTPTPTPAKPIVIGIPTSYYTVHGRDNIKTLELAAEEINSKYGGIKVGEVVRPVKVIKADTRGGEPGIPVHDALMTYEKMITTQHPDAIIVGAFRSEVLMAVMDLVSEHKLIHLGGIAQTPKFGERVKANYDKYKYMFRVTTHSKIVGSGMFKGIDFLRQKYGFNRMFYMLQDTLWARATGDALKALSEKVGWKTVGYELFPVGTTDFSAGFTKAKDAKAQVIIFVYDAPEAGIFLKQWKAMEVPALVFGSGARICTPRAWDVFKEDLDYVLGIEFPAGCSQPIEKLPKSVHLYKLYKEKYGEEPEAAATNNSAYDGLYIYKNAVERAGTLDPDALVKALEETDYMGVPGRMRFEKDTHEIIWGWEDPEKAAIGGDVFQWQKGKRVVVWPPFLAEGEIKLPPWLK